MNACPDCGSELTDSAAYCPECGFSVGDVAVTAASAKDEETASGSNVRILVLIGGFVALCTVRRSAPPWRWERRGKQWRSRV
jgi:uncharacterized membrane protein YvbJ